MVWLVWLGGKAVCLGFCVCTCACVCACLPARMRCAVDGVGFFFFPPLIPLLRAHLQGWLPLPAVKLVMQWGLVWFLSTNLSTQWVFGVSFVCRCLIKQIVLHGTKERCSFVQEELLRCQQQIKDIFTPSSRFVSLLQRHIHSRSELVRGTVYRRRWLSHVSSRLDAATFHSRVRPGLRLLHVRHPS